MADSDFPTSIYIRREFRPRDGKCRYSLRICRRIELLMTLYIYDITDIDNEARDRVYIPPASLYQNISESLEISHFAHTNMHASHENTFI